MVNGERTNIASMAADVVDGMKEKIVGPESALGEINILGMKRPLTEYNFLGQLSEKGGILNAFQTGIKRQTDARKTAARNPGRTPPRQRPPPRNTDQIPRGPPPTPSPTGQPERTEIVL